MARRLPALAVEADEPGKLLEVADVRNKHQVVAHLARPLERLRRADGGDPDRRVRLLRRTRVDRDVLPAMEPAVEGHVLLGPEAHASGDTLLIAGAAVLDRHAKRLELVGQEGPREAGVEAAIRDAVEHRQLAGVLQRVVERGHDGAGDEPDVWRALRGGAEEDDRVRAGAAVGLEMMLHDADRGEAELVGTFGQVQALREVLRADFCSGRKHGKKLIPNRMANLPRQ